MLKFTTGIRLLQMHLVTHRMQNVEEFILNVVVSPTKKITQV